MTREEAKRRMEICRDFLANNYSDMGEPNFTAFNMAIQALSQEPCGDCRNCKKWDDCECGKKGHINGTSIGYSIGECKDYEPCDDAISRKAVLSIIGGWYEQNRETENIEDLIILITYMDSVTPKSRECEDVISRAEVKRIVYFYKEQYDGIYHINESIDNLPSVTQKSEQLYKNGFADGYEQGHKDAEQKSGKWIVDSPHYICSECNYVHHLQRFEVMSGCKLGNYCPNCGAKMESEDKE